MVACTTVTPSFKVILSYKYSSFVGHFVLNLNTFLPFLQNFVKSSIFNIFYFDPDTFLFLNQTGMTSFIFNHR